MASAAIKFLVPPQGGYVTAMQGVDALGDDPHVVRWTMSTVAGTEVAAPVDNACYLGHVVAIDRNGQGARYYAERALKRVELTFGEAPVAA